MKREFAFVVAKIYFLLLAFIVLFRVQFWLFNHDYLPFYLNDFLQGLHFDISLVGYLSLFTLPLFYLSSFIKMHRRWKNATFFLGFTLFAPCLLTECWDLVYFQYTLKRSSMDTYLFFGSGDDLDQLVILLQRFWYVVILLFAWLTAFFLCLRWVLNTKTETDVFHLNIYLFIACLFVSFLFARHSFGPKPLGIMDATIFGEPGRSQLRLNSPFVVLKTIHNPPLPHHEYMKEDMALKYFNPVQSRQGKHKEIKPNLVFIILESFGNQQLKQFHEGISITPFLDSLLYKDTSVIFSEGFSNGKTSIECLPAMFAGIPSLMEVPFVLSNFSTNRIQALPYTAQQKGYSTLFFHGAEEGSMRFGATATQMGFKQQYFKERIFGNPQFIGSWGYHDEIVFKTMLSTLNKVKTPFFSTVFTLSSHEPFDIPKHQRKKHPKLTKEQASYRYTDDCLRAFFQEAKKASWYGNTLFIITGDHTPVHLDRDSYTIEDYYSVPIAVVNCPLKIKPPDEHLQIVPWIYKILDWDTKWYGYGDIQHPDKIRYLNGVFYIWNNHYTLQFDENKNTWKSSGNPTLFSQEKALSKLRFLAMLQRFRNDLMQNKLGV
ncbi:MAG: alkaline phosphatase family protein [Flavobacteriia bacterium]|nr:alkaline phosphatase family protein [Flavobacteriia bacterium]